jgi:ABC-type amino acid transport substrate-binding protein
LVKHDDIEFVGVSRKGPEILDKVAKQYGFKVASEDYREVLNAGIDVCVIGSPTGLHHEHAKAALEAGQIDAIVVDLPTALYISAVEIEGTSVIGQFPGSAGEASDNFGAVFTKDNPLVDCVDQALALLKTNGRLDKIQQAWLSDNAGVPVISVD